jgi:hypothetical protein
MMITVRLSTRRVLTPFSEPMMIKRQEFGFILALASLNLTTEEENQSTMTWGRRSLWMKLIQTH